MAAKGVVVAKGVGGPRNGGQRPSEVGAGDTMSDGRQGGGGGCLKREGWPSKGGAWPLRVVGSRRRGGQPPNRVGGRHSGRMAGKAGGWPPKGGRDRQRRSVAAEGVSAAAKGRGSRQMGGARQGMGGGRRRGGRVAEDGAGPQKWGGRGQRADVAAKEQAWLSNGGGGHHSGGVVGTAGGWPPNGVYGQRRRALHDGHRHE